MQITQTYRTPDRLTELVRNIKEIDAAIENKNPALGLATDWVSPISILPLVVYANNNNKQINYLGKDMCIRAYLKAIGFPDGITRLASVKKNHIPITKLTCGRENPLLSDYEERILSGVSKECQTSFRSGLKFLTSELQNNVEEHAKIDQYWTFAQYWKRTKTCEIGIADTGIGYKDSYRGTKHEVGTHEDAIKNALSGLSSKPFDERGCGVSGIVKMFIKGYKGELIIMSGNSLLYAYNKKTIFYNCPISWQGAFVGLKFRVKDIDVSQYY